MLVCEFPCSCMLVFFVIRHKRRESTSSMEGGDAGCLADIYKENNSIIDACLQIIKSKEG